MAINKKELTEAGTQFYPETHIEAVIDGNGNTLDTLLSGKQDTLVSGTSIKTVNSTSLLGSGNVSVGTYSKPSGGIPKTDLASAVQTSLGLADTALQSFTESDPVFGASAAHGISSSDISSWNGKQDAISDLSDIRSGASAGATAYQLPSSGIPKTDLASAVQTSLGKADTALQSFTETDPVFSASAAAGISSSDITNWNGKTSNIGTITSVKMNGSTVSSSGEADLGTVITSHQDISGKADKVSSATNGNFAGLDSNGNLVDSGHKHSDYLTSFTETDPTVPSWAKASSKPSYTLDEVSDGSTRKLADYLLCAGGTMEGNLFLRSGSSSLYITGSDTAIVTGTTGTFSSPGTSTLGMAYGSTALRGQGDPVWKKYDAEGNPTDYTIYHSGNSDKSTKSWACSTLSTNGASTFSGGHLYLTGSNASSSTGNTTQIVFGTSSNNHVAISSNSNAVFINPTTSTTTGQIALGVNGANTYFSSAGNFGIGTNSPSKNFHAVGSSRFDIPSFTDFQIKRTSDYGSAGITFYPGNQTTNYWVAGADPNSSTTSIAYRYFWYYKNTYTGYLTTGGNMVITGAYTPGSDTRIKDNQQEISKEQAFSVLEDLKPKTWVWNEKAGEDKHGKTCAGLVAQEVEEILPDAVVVSECGAFKDFHSLNYNMVQGYEIAAIKGLIEENKSLKSEVAELKEKLNAIIEMLK